MVTSSSVINFGRERDVFRCFVTNLDDSWIILIFGASLPGVQMEVPDLPPSPVPIVWAQTPRPSVLASKGRSRGGFWTTALYTRSTFHCWCYPVKVLKTSTHILEFPLVAKFGKTRGNSRGTLDFARKKLGKKSRRASNSGKTRGRETLGYQYYSSHNIHQCFFKVLTKPPKKTSQFFSPAAG